MEAAHFTVVRIAEFAWSSMEPSEGHYEWGWLDRAIRLFEKHHIAVVLGTPTATPPAWLTQKYPETLRVEAETANASRTATAPTARRPRPNYREHCRRIAEHMAKRFGHNPTVVGWQIDNEYGYGQMSYDDDTREAVPGLAEGEVQDARAALNAHWTTSYWSQTYDNWSEIPIPVGGNNPGLMLDWKRFVTDAWTCYQQNQIDVIRAQRRPAPVRHRQLHGLGSTPSITTRSRSR